MTSPAFVVLTLALVCSIFGTASEQTADRASEHTTLHHPTMTGTRTEDMPPHMPLENTPKFDVSFVGDDFKNPIGNNIAPVPFDFRSILGNKITPTAFEDELENYRGNQIATTKFGDDFKNTRGNKIAPILNNKNYKFETKNNVLKTMSNKYHNLEDNFRNTRGNKIAPILYNENEEFGTINNDLKTISNKYLNLGEDRTRVFEERKTRWKPKTSISFNTEEKVKRVKRAEDPEKCELFYFKEDKMSLEHPHNELERQINYYRNLSCVTVITAPDGHVVKLTFVDVFNIEHHPKCAYDYLEIRDGKFGYAKLLGRHCGQSFPAQVKSSGPYMWLKFNSDDTIEYEGFKIKLEFEVDTTSYKIPDSCYISIDERTYGDVATTEINDECLKKSEGHHLDVLWNITGPANKSLYLNFTEFTMARPNECEQNYLQIFGYVLEFDAKLAHYCGSMANPQMTKANDPHSNVMYVHLYASQNARNATKVFATFTAFRNLSPNDHCPDGEFDCEDNTCIDSSLMCNSYGNCRLKTDEDTEHCKQAAESTLKETHIIVILVIFSLILSGMSFVFLFKCIRKLYQDHKIIKEHIRQSCEDNLGALVDSRFTLDPKRLSEPRERASLERENHANELFKQQRSISQHKQSSIESDFQETHLDIDEAPWVHREVETIPEAHDIKVEPQRNGRSRRSDTSKKEESIRSRKESLEERKKEIRDAAVGVPDTKESGCQTRESLFQADTAPSSDGSNSNSNSRGFSTFGYSGATLVRPSPPPPMVSSVQIELLRQIPSQDSTKSQKKLPDRRPMSTETTRSAPDVIIVSKPIR